MSEEDRRNTGSAEPSTRLCRERVEELYALHANELRRFLTGLTRDAATAADLLQATFAKAIEQAKDVRPESLKSWLFQVAYREWAAAVRRGRVHDRAKERIARPGATEVTAADHAESREEAKRLHEALSRLPGEQQEVVRLRMKEDKTFAEIAVLTGAPLGTVLSRMQAALKRLRKVLDDKP